MDENAQFLKTEAEIKAWLDEYQIKKYTLIADDTYGFIVDVDGDADLPVANLEFLPVKFNRVKGDFIIARNPLTTLKGAPEYVGLNFNCSDTNITSLKHSPLEIGGSFLASRCKLTNLEFLTPKISEHIFLDGNAITSLKGSPREVGGDFNIKDNPLGSLKGGPQYVKRSFNCYNTNITSLKYSPLEVGWALIADCCNLTNLNFIPPKIGSMISLSENDLISLKGSPEEVNGMFSISFNKNLNSLEGGPKKVIEHFFIAGCLLPNLEHSPSYVGGEYHCGNNKLTSLKGISKHIGGKLMTGDGGIAGNNTFNSLDDFPEVLGGNFSFNNDNQDLAMYQGLTGQQVADIVKATKEKQFLLNEIKPIEISKPEGSIIKI